MESVHVSGKSQVETLWGDGTNAKHRGYSTHSSDEVWRGECSEWAECFSTHIKPTRNMKGKMLSIKAKVYVVNNSLNHKSNMRRESHLRFCER